MRAVHIFGVGLIVGFTALGALLAVMTYRWAEAAYPASQAPPVAQQPAGGGAAPAAPGAASAPAAVAPVAAGNAQQGKALFEQNCISCHTIGGGKKVGPDLKGVTAERPHDWLVQFITAPDKVIASGDSTAQQLVKQYGMPMPNLGITQAQAEDILAYIQSQSGGADAQPGPSSPAATASLTARAGPFAPRLP